MVSLKGGGIQLKELANVIPGTQVDTIPLNELER